MRKILLLIATIFIGVLFSSAVLFFTESGRNFLISHAMKYFFQDRVTISVSEVDPMINDIGLVTVKTADGISVRLENIKVSREGFFGIPYFKIKKVQLKNVANLETPKVVTGTDNSSKEENGLQEKINYVARFIPMFTLGVEIKNFDASINDKTYYLHNVKLSSKDLSLSFQSDEYGTFFVKLDVGIMKAPEVAIDFSNCYNANGTLIIKNISSTEKDFHLTAKKDLFNIEAYGNFIKPTEEIVVNKGRIVRQDDAINFTGRIYLKDKTVNAKIPVELQQIPTIIKIITKLPQQATKEVLERFDSSTLNLSAKFDDGYSTKFDIEKENKKIVSAKISHSNLGIKILGDFHKMDIYGYTINRFSAIIVNNKISATLFGQHFDISAVLDKKGNDFSISKFDIVSKFGKIRLKNPIDFPLNFLKKNFVKLEFDINDLSFFCRTFSNVKGKGRGTIEYTGFFNSFDVRGLKFKAFSSQFLYGKTYGKNFNLNWLKDRCNFSSDEINIDKVNMKKVVGDIQRNSFKIKWFLSKESEMNVQGKISNDFRKITALNGTVGLGKNSLKIQNSTVDFLRNSCSIDGVFSGHKKKSAFQFEFNSKKCWLSLTEIHLQDFAKIINRRVRGIVNGSIELRHKGGIFQGRGNLSLLNVLTRNNVADIDVVFQPTGVKLNSVLQKRRNQVNVDFSVPIVLNSSMKIVQTNGKLMAHIYGKNKLENFFELPDKSSLQGDFDCDCYLSGSLKKPQISGKLSIKNMLIVVNSVILSNGELDFVASGDKLHVKSAKFVDNQKNIVTATGYGRLFFEDFLPNLDVNLDLDFNKFFVLNSDTTKVQVTGKGKMYGPIHNMKLSGDLIVPYAEISSFTVDDSLEKSKIKYENDPVLFHKNKGEENGESFFDFDIKMHCRKIKVRGKNFDLFLKGDLLLSMFEKQDTLIGNLVLSDGTMNLFGKRMKFIKGEVTFFQKYPYDPKAFFLCRKNFGNMLVSVEIKNSIKKGASVVLSSNPSYSQDAILSQILFNKDTKSLSAGEAAQLVQAVSGLKNQGYLLSILGALTSTGLWDNISFSSDSGKYSSSLNTDTQTSTQQVNISAGKYLQDNIYMSLNKKNDKATFDIDLSVSPTVSVKANTAGEVGLNWKYRY